MSIYFPADDSVHEMLKQLMNTNHQDLVKARVDIGVTIAMSSKENQPALKEHGQPIFGLTKIVSAKDRVRKAVDAEIYLDGDAWNSDRRLHQLAKLDYLLMRLEVKKPKAKKKKKTARHGSDEETKEHEDQEFLVDAGGKAALKMRKPDLFVPGGYREIIERHGDYAPEHSAIHQALAIVENAIAVHDAALTHVPEVANIYVGAQAMLEDTTGSNGVPLGVANHCEFGGVEFEQKNNRRVELINKRVDGSLSTEEEAEFQALQTEILAVTKEKFPVPPIPNNTI